MSKHDFTNGVTPKGSLLFPHIYEPETYEGKDVGYTVNIKFDQKETDALIAVIDKELEKAKHSINLKPGQKWSAEPFLGYKEDKDGDIVFKFKANSHYTTKSGDMHKVTIPVFDAHGSKNRCLLVMALLQKLHTLLYHTGFLRLSMVSNFVLMQSRLLT